MKRSSSDLHSSQVLISSTLEARGLTQDPKPCAVKSSSAVVEQGAPPGCAASAVPQPQQGCYRVTLGFSSQVAAFNCLITVGILSGNWQR